MLISAPYKPEGIDAHTQDALAEFRTTYYTGVDTNGIGIHDLL